MSLTPQQIQDRKLGIGGSDAGIIMGYSTISPLQLYLNKTSAYEFEFSDAAREGMRWGNLLEPLVLEEYARMTGHELAKPLDSIVNPNYPWMRANLDFFAVDQDYIGEIKTAAYMGHEWGSEGTDEIPLGYKAQCAHNRIVAEAKFGRDINSVHLPVFSGNRIKVFIYRKDALFESELIEHERRFWEEHVEKGIPPKPNSFDDVKILYPHSDGDPKVATDEMMDLYFELSHVKGQGADYEKREGEIKETIAKFLGDSPYLMDAEGNKLISFKSQTRETINTKALKEAHPDICEQFTKTSESRPFLCLKVK